MPLRKQIAILGGGVGGVSAAWFLTDPAIQGRWQDRYDVTLYQVGWRLGGKGASGRGKHQRIEEHGLHVWMGVYRNAFRMIQNCYAELGMSWETAFASHDQATVYEERDGQLQPFTITFPHFEHEDPGSDGLFPSVIDLLLRLADWARKVLLDSLKSAEDRQRFDQWLNELRKTLVDIQVFVQEQALDKRLMEVDLLPDVLRLRIQLDLEHLEIITRDMLPLTAPNASVSLPAILAANLAFATLRGCLREKVATRGFDVLDKYEIREFLRKYGAPDVAINSVVVRGVYDLTFAYPKGIHSNPAAADGDMAAGVFIRIALRIFFGYKRAFVFKMLGGMGDVVFTPLYDALKARGVRFEFFHRVRDLRPQGNQIGEIEFGVQATTKNGDVYDPIRIVNGRRVWPNRPKYELLNEGADLQTGTELPDGGYNLESAWTGWFSREERKVLRLGDGFDIVIMAIPPEALKYICARLIETNDSWRRMVENVQSVQTEHFQIWTSLTSDELGGLGPLRTVFGGHHQSGGDFSFLIPMEETGQQGARSCYYFCSEIPHSDNPPPPYRPAPDYPKEQLERVKTEARGFLESRLESILPGLYHKHGFKWDSLIDADGGRGKNRLDAQFFRINVDPSERYVLSVKDSTRHRLPAAESGFLNLFLAGDWTRGGFNAGSVESAVSSAMQAVRGYTNEPQIVIGENDFDWRNKNFPVDLARKTSFDVNRKPTYVGRPAELSYMQPIRFEEVGFTGLILKGNRRALQAVLDRELNNPSGGNVTYVPAPLSRLMIGVLEISRALPTAESSDYGKGWIPLVDAAFWIPILRVNPLPIALLWYQPFLFVDAPWAVISGRETWGVHKSSARIRIDWRDATRPLQINTETVERFDPIRPEQAQMRLLVEARGTGKELVLREMGWKTYSELFAYGLGPNLVGDLDAWTKARVSAIGPIEFDSSSAAQIRVASLKQIRDVADGSRASYQAVVETSGNVGAVSNAGFLTGDLDIQVIDFASHPVARYLGLEPVQRVLSVVRATFDFELGNGSELWRA